MASTFTPFSAVAGGALIGLAAAALLLVHGRIAGIGGVLGGVLRPRPGDLPWRLWFLAGLVGGGALIGLAHPQAVSSALGTPALVSVAAGLLVGFGTRLGNGCTSGHGVCGIGRLSPRSFVATATFMVAGFLTVFVVRHLLGRGS
jgi:uncharacterized membrane protein YedE/YeeE